MEHKRKKRLMLVISMETQTDPLAEKSVPDMEGPSLKIEIWDSFTFSSTGFTLPMRAATIPVGFSA